MTRVLHDPTQPEFVKSAFRLGSGDEDRLEPNFTEVKGPILTLLVCSYERTSQVAEEMATGILIQRAVERSD